MFHPLFCFLGSSLPEFCAYRYNRFTHVRTLKTNAYYGAKIVGISSTFQLKLVGGFIVSVFLDTPLVVTSVFPPPTRYRGVLRVLRSVLFVTVNTPPLHRFRSPRVLCSCISPRLTTAAVSNRKAHVLTVARVRSTNTSFLDSLKDFSMELSCVILCDFAAFGPALVYWYTGM